MTIAIVSFELEAFVRLYQQELAQPWRYISDPQRIIYDRFQMHSGSWFKILGWTAMKTYLYLVFGKRRPVKRPTSGDFQQLGGDVLIDPHGIVRLHYKSENPADRPDAKSILAIVERRSDRTPNA